MLDDLSVIALDMAAKLDEAARFEAGKFWGAVEFPPPFGRPPSEEESYIQELDGKTGASLKLTILNPKGRIWTMIAGGGASVIYADTICDLGFQNELANYGEYSGAPSESATYEYAKTILKLMTKDKHEHGKVLIIGGGIANFTNVADTFKGIIRALTEFADKVREYHIKIYVRRGGPNYQEGLNMMRQLAVDLDLQIVVHGPDRHMTSVVSMALGQPALESESTPPPSPPSGGDRVIGLSAAPTGPMRKSSSAANLSKQAESKAPSQSPPPKSDSKSNLNGPSTKSTAALSRELFSSETKAIVYGMQPDAVQNMLDFDFLNQRPAPSVVAMVYPFAGNHLQKFYWYELQSIRVASFVGTVM